MGGQDQSFIKEHAWIEYHKTTSPNYDYCILLMRVGKNM